MTKLNNRIEIVRVEESRRRHRAVLIDGRFAELAPRDIQVLGCLTGELGRVVTYKRLCSALGYSSHKGAHRHTLRQYISKLAAALAEHKLPYVIAVANHVGYALCEVSPQAKPPSPAKQAARKRNGLGRATGGAHRVR